VAQAFKEMIVISSASGIVYTPAISGVNANFLRESNVTVGIDPQQRIDSEMDFGTKLLVDDSNDSTKPWKDIWSAGQGVGSIRDVPGAGQLVEQLISEYYAALEQQRHCSEFLA